MEQRRTVNPAGCAPATRCVAQASCAPSCTITLSPSTVNLVIGGTTGTITATTNCNYPISQVTFTPGNSSIATVSPGTDTTSPYRTTVTGVGVGSTTIRGTVYVGGSPVASDTTIVNSVPPNPWWQVKDSDVGTGGDLTSQLPAGIKFDLDGPGGMPGIPSYGASSNLNGGNTSSTGWLAQSSPVGSKVYDYDTLSAQIPSDATINTINSSSVNGSNFNAGNSSYGYTWYRYSGNVPLTISGPISLGSKKVILLVNGNLNIAAPINLTKGSGFFMVLVKGNITVDPAMGGNSPDLEGLYEADGTFSDGSGNKQLHIRGSLVAYRGVNLQRDLAIGNVTTAAEMFEFAPDQILMFPGKLGLRRLNWKEVAP